MAEGERTFHLFPRLPAELRLQVWEQSLDYEREVDITVRVEFVRDLSARIVFTPGTLASARHLLSRTSTPTILHTCREGRYSWFYQKAFSEIPL